MRTKRIAIAVLNVVLVIALAATGVVAAVDPQSVKAAGDFNVPTAQYPTIQTAIDAAAAAGGGTVQVAAGTYHELITLRNGVEVQGAGATNTIINGDTTGDGAGDGSVVTANNVDSTAKLDGFTITEGSASIGGGMCNKNSSPTVTNCTFSGNSTAGSGGGMCNYNSSSPVVTGCMFSSNSAGVAGETYKLGGGMYNYNSSSPVVVSCIFSGNSASDGGGIANWASSPTVTDCTFLANSVTYGGGGMGNWVSSTPAVTGCTFTGNSAGGGGGMYSDNSRPAVANCFFSNNSATGDGGGGMYNWASSSSTVTNCTFTGNSATNGSGILNSNSSSPRITNCILWGDSQDEISNVTSSPTVNCCDVDMNDPAANPYPGTGNINADPLFADASASDLHLRGSSPCIDKGDNSAVPTGVTTDFEGNPRISDGDGDGSAIVDMGADEAARVVISSVDPGSGKQKQHLTVTISGSNFDGATIVSFGSGITVEGFSVVSSTEITAEIAIDAKAAKGTRDVSVTTAWGTATKTDGFTVVGGGGGVCGGGALAAPGAPSEMTTTLVALGLLLGVGYLLVRRGTRDSRDSVRA
jgi:parallel beta-helix repeat protein